MQMRNSDGESNDPYYTPVYVLKNMCPSSVADVDLKIDFMIFVKQFGKFCLVIIEMSVFLFNESKAFHMSKNRIAPGDFI